LPVLCTVIKKTISCANFHFSNNVFFFTAGNILFLLYYVVFVVTKYLLTVVRSLMLPRVLLKCHSSSFVVKPFHYCHHPHRSSFWYQELV